MSLLDTVRNAVAIADTLTKPLQTTVAYARKTVVDAYGAETLSSSNLLAIVEWKQRQVRDSKGILTMSSATVLFLDVSALSTATGGNGAGTDDLVTLPGRPQMPIMAVGGFLDSETGKPFATEAYL